LQASRSFLESFQERGISIDPLQHIQKSRISGLKLKQLGPGQPLRVGYWWLIGMNGSAGLTVSIRLNLLSFYCPSVLTKSGTEAVSWRTITGLSSKPPLIVKIALM